jgi:uncharacterized membrane protein YcaP (DUF421 family)
MSASFLTFSMSPLEVAIRGSLMYWFLFVIFRFILRRNAGSTGITDILFVVVLGDASQNAMIGNGQTVADGAMLIATLVAWNYLLDYLSSRFDTVAKLTDAPPVVMIRNGRLQFRNMRREYVTQEEIHAKLRSEDVERAEDVRAMYLESDGSFSVLKKNRK